MKCVHPKRILLFLHSIYSDPYLQSIPQSTCTHIVCNSIFICPVYKCVCEYQIISECLSFICLFIYLFCSLLISQFQCIENIPFLALNNNFIIKYLSCRFLFCIHHSIHIATILPPAEFLSHFQKLG